MDIIVHIFLKKKNIFFFSSFKKIMDFKYLPKIEESGEIRKTSEDEIQIFTEYVDDTRLYSQIENPDQWISILITSFNTNINHLEQCVKSIRDQRGNFGIEIVWVDDGSTEEFNRHLEKVLESFSKTPNTKVVYKKMMRNMGLPFCLNRGLLLCSNEIVFRMDSDDIMRDDRIQKQLQFMNNTPNCVVCGANIELFDNVQGVVRSDHPSFTTWEKYVETKPTWFMNHPTLCFRKSAVLSVGNYITERVPFEDLELELRLLKKYGVVYCVQDILLLYRIHNQQICKKSDNLSYFFEPLKKDMIETIIHSPYTRKLLPVNSNELKAYRFVENEENYLLEEYLPSHISPS